MDDLTRLNFSNIIDSCHIISDFLRRTVLDTNENPRGFYVSLPKLCSVIFGSNEYRGWLHRRNTLQEDQAIFELLKPNGVFLRAILKLYNERGFVYEIQPERLPARTKNLLTPQSYQLLSPLYRARIQFTSLPSPIGAGTATPTAPSSTVKLMFNMYEYYMFYFVYAVTIETPALSPLAGLSQNDPIDLTQPLTKSASSASTLARRAVAAKDTFNKYTHLADPSARSLSYSPSGMVKPTTSQLASASSASRPSSLKQSIYTDLQRQYQAYFLPFFATTIDAVAAASIVPGTPTLTQRTFSADSTPFPASPTARFSKRLPGVVSTPLSMAPGSAQTSGDLTDLTALSQTPTTTSVSNTQSAHTPPFAFAGVFEDPDLDLGPQRHEIALASAEFFAGAAVELWVGQCQIQPGGDATITAAAAAAAAASATKPTEDLLLSIASFVRHVVEADLRLCFEERGGGLGLGEDPMVERREVVNGVKKAVYVLLQPRLYWFLKWSMVNWPMEDSFVYITDIWITWITPWRLGQRPTSKQAEHEPILETGWAPFVLDNSPFYLALCPEFLARAASFSYVDADARRYGLASLPSASGTAIIHSTMQREISALGRLASALRADGLYDLLANSERALAAPERYAAEVAAMQHPGPGGGSARFSLAVFSAASPSPTRRFSSTLPALGSPTAARQVALAAQVARWLPAMRSKAAQLEFLAWKPLGLFPEDGNGREVLLKVLVVVRTAIQAREGVMREGKGARKEGEKEEGFWDRAKRAYEKLMISVKEEVGEEAKRARCEQQIRKLKELGIAIGKAFNIDDTTIDILINDHPYDTGAAHTEILSSPLLFQFPSHAAQTYRANRPAPGPASDVFVRPDATPQRHGYLDPEARRLVRRGMRKCNADDIPAVGPRAERMVRSYEWAWLVRITLALEKITNEKYAALMTHLTQKVGLPLPAFVVTFHVPLRWLAAPRNWLFLVVLWLGLWLSFRILGAIFFASPRLAHGSVFRESAPQPRATPYHSYEQFGRNRVRDLDREREARYGAYNYGRDLNGPRVAGDGRIVYRV
ncbi:hypothetical protein BC937DRAFT_87566 [Endogone sp. FLAS-F59071]|nr:hypothetical protein BC937DRAFT_87566 [Endogone sp. FLAS-F59071]|eukprot:RUS19391.1 hypothetical protein BC937DRAFT_87566 [Endogone sp. FLAS-F59071]